MVAGDYPAAKMMLLLSDVVFMVQVYVMIMLFIKDKSLPSVLREKKSHELLRAMDGRLHD